MSSMADCGTHAVEEAQLVGDAGGVAHQPEERDEHRHRRKGGKQQIEGGAGRDQRNPGRD